MKAQASSPTQRRLRVLIAPDKFKGTLSAQAATRAIATGWKQARPKDVLELFPISDGGDGFGELYGKHVNAKPRLTATADAAGRTCRSKWYWEPATRTAIIDSSAAIGLAMLPARRFHPFDLDTFGLGKLLKAAAKTGAEHLILGIGGSATNDGGFGLALSLGWKFLEANGKEILRWMDLKRLHSIRPPDNPLSFKRVTVAVDVQNELLGPQGASRVYGPQKGLEPKDFKSAEAALRQLASITRERLGRDIASHKGAGAAGGLGFGLAAFLGAQLVPGFELFAKLSGLQIRVANSDLVITGEGAIDRSTMMGKGVGQLARLCKKLNVPCHALAGQIEPTVAMTRIFNSMMSSIDFTSRTQAIERPQYWLSQAARNLAVKV